MAPVASCWLSLMSREPSSLCRSDSREGERRDRRKKRNTSQLPTSPSDESHSYSHYFILTLLTFAVYANSVHGDFVHDDMAAIVTNEDTLGKTPVWDLLRNDFWGMDIRDRWCGHFHCHHDHKNHHLYQLSRNFIIFLPLSSSSFQSFISRPSINLSKPHSFSIIISLSNLSPPTFPIHQINTLSWDQILNSKTLSPHFHYKFSDILSSSIL